MTTPVPLVETGRGAWTKIGKDNGSRYYEFKSLSTFDGNQPTRDVNYQAVALAVKAIQNRLKALGYKHPVMGAIPITGLYGPRTKWGIQWFQKSKGLVADGICGPTTAKALWHGLINEKAAVHGVPPSHIYGMTYLESAMDPGAVGYTTPTDRGLTQINLKAHPTITVEQAFDPNFALNYTADRLRKAREQFSGKGPELQKDCSIAQHNSPLNALQWYQAGVAPNERIQKYVDLVLGAAATYKP
jgi:soluble lytic murein transglycosylase-like protein